MTLFFICAALLVVLCLAWLLVGMYSRNVTAFDQEAVNITLARERGETLSEALATGSIDQATYDYEREQLDHDLAADLTINDGRGSKKHGHTVAAIIITAFVPIAAGALYLQLGDPGAINRDRAAGQTGSMVSNARASDSNPSAPGPLAELLPQLEERLSANPDDVQGWRLLGRSYLSTQNYSKARYALEKAVALEEDEYTTLTTLAEAIAMENGGDLSGEPMRILTRSLELNPRYEHTLWLMSIGQQQAGDHQSALRGFNLLMGLAQGNEDAIATIDQMRSRSIQALGAESVRQATGTKDSEASPDSAATAQIEVSVSLNAEAAASSQPDQLVFVYATATSGPPMPLAVARLTVRELPTTVLLNDSMAMIPSMKLSTFDSVTIGARVSSSGNPIAQPGDWFTESSDVLISETASIELQIDQVTP